MRDKYADWLRPRDVLARIDVGNEDQKKEAIFGRLRDGLIEAFASNARFSQKGSVSSTTDIPLVRDLWAPPWKVNVSGFWTFGDVNFDDQPNEWERIAAHNRGEEIGEHVLSTASFRNVRLNPHDVAREFSLAPAPSPAEAERPAASSPARPGGRPAGKDGEPIAYVTRRLLALPQADLERSTAESVATELIAEYQRLGLAPPSLDNAKR